MKKYIGSLLLIVLFYGLFSCTVSTTHREAIKLNNTINKINDSLFAKEKQWGKMMAYAVSSGDYTKLKQVRKEFEKQIDSSRKQIAGLADVGGSEDFRKSEQELLLFEKKMTAEDFVPFEKLRYNTPMIKVSICIDKIKEAGKQEKTLLDKLTGLRDAYQEKNGFKFIKPKN